MKTRAPLRNLAIGLLGVALVVFGWLYGSRWYFWSVEGNPELERLESRYGEKHYSWNNEEWFIRDFFQDAREGFFVDVGAYHYKDLSNTFYLEEHLGWGGIAIDAQEKFRAGYVENRPATKYFTYFVSDRSTGEKEFFVPEAIRPVASADPDHIERHGVRAAEATAVLVTEITLDDLLDREGVSQIDFLTMDIELAEPAALRGFDIQRFAPRLVCIEEHPEVREFIDDYFRSNGYQKLELWSRLDSHNAYYAPPDEVEAWSRRRG